MICVPQKNLFTGIHTKKCENYTELTKKKNQKQIFYVRKMSGTDSGADQMNLE